MKQFKLFKTRPPADPGWREAPWYFTFTFRRQRYKRCLETADATKARARAATIHRTITEAVIRGRLEDIEGTRIRRIPAATLGELIAAYRQHAQVKDAEANVNALRNVLRTAGESDRDDTSSSVLTPGVILAYLGAAASRLTPHTQVSTLRQAMSLFTPAMLFVYDSLKLRLPDLAKVHAAIRARQPRLPEIAYNPPPEATIRQTLADWEQLDDRNLFLAIGHCLAFGLRKGEVIQLDWSHHTVREHVPCLWAAVDQKNGARALVVRALDPFYTAMSTIARRRGWDGRDTLPAGPSSNPVLTGHETERTDAVWRRVSAFLTARGWETDKKAHTLRAYAGGCVAMRYDIYEASRFLRHSSVQVTEQHYGHYIRTFRPENPETLPWRWAVEQGQPAITILPAATA